MTTRKAIIIGAGHYGEALLTYLVEGGYTIVGFIDDDPLKKGTIIRDIPVIGSFNDVVNDNLTTDFEAVFCAIGNNEARVKFLSKMRAIGYEVPDFIHDSVQITKDTMIGVGVYIFPNCTLMPHTIVKDYTIISIGSVITHHTTIGQGVLISCGVTIGANVTIEEEAIIGVGASIKSGDITISKRALVGAGCVVIKDVPENGVVVGNPGKVIKTRT